MSLNGSVQQRMMKVLSDGVAHRREELHACLHDELGPMRNISAHLVMLRRQLRPLGQSISCTRLDGQIYYCLVRLVAPSDQ